MAASVLVTRVYLRGARVRLLASSRSIWAMEATLSSNSGCKSFSRPSACATQRNESSVLCPLFSSEVTVARETPARGEFAGPGTEPSAVKPQASNPGADPASKAVGRKCSSAVLTDLNVMASR